MKDTKRGQEIPELATEGLLAINRCGLQGKFKVWCLQFMLIPKLLWSLLIYEICSTTFGAINDKINKFPQKMVRGTCGSHRRGNVLPKTKVKLPLKSIVEEYKSGKVRLLSMFEDSEAPVVNTKQPTIKTCRK